MNAAIGQAGQSVLDACNAVVYDLGRLTGELHNSRGIYTAGDMKSVSTEIMRIWSGLRPVIESYAPLLALAHQYARECGDCAGTRVCPDDSPCEQCADIWAVIDRAEGQS